MTELRIIVMVRIKSGPGLVSRIENRIKQTSFAKRQVSKKKSRGKTLRTVLRDYLESKPELRQSSVRIYNALVAHHLSDWIDLPLSSISSAMIEKKHSDIGTHSTEASKLQANMVMRIMRMLFNFALRRYHEKNGRPLLRNNPVDVLTQNKRWYRATVRQGMIPDSKLTRWYSALKTVRSETVRDYLLFVLLTGFRRAEAASLRWSDIDFEAKTVAIDGERTKNHRAHVLPLSSFLTRLLKRRFATSKSDFVFPGRRAGITHFDATLQKLREQSNCHFTIHDLRRTFLTKAESLGIPHYALKKLANHSVKNDTTFGYLVIDVERLRQPMEKITNNFLKLMGHEEAPSKIRKNASSAF